MPRLVLVHSPLVGASTWEPVAEVLRGRGYGVTVPSLAPVEGGPYYPRLAARAADEVAGGERVVLVGHSGAGALLPAVAEAARARGAAVAGAVYVDALLPHPGRAWFATVPPELAARLRELARDGVLPPWDTWFPPGTVEALLPDPAVRARFSAELPRVPLAYFAEPAPPAPALPPARTAYLQLSEAYEPQAAAAEREGWRVARIAADHLAVLTAADEVGGELAELVRSVAA
ncbi:alpha/beta fold hydrolase [Streptomyces coryli]|nr:alpha/beta fold hydrolase [Streptomyces coryli]